MRLLIAITLLASAGAARDSDGDGLSDFAERHKYRTDPGNADSDGDGTPDGDWDERREYAYTVRTVVRVMGPAAAICDDYQDAGVLAETDEYVELEVVHYPLNTVAEGIAGRRDWRDAADRPAAYLASTTTSNWDGPMRAALLAELRGAGIDPDALDDRTFVERTAALLMDRAERTADFTTFFTWFPGFPDGEPAILPGLEAAVARYDPGGLTMEERWQRDLFARGMFAHRTHGSCTSTAIYLQGCLRAVGIPTRTVQCIPAIDASDPEEVAMLDGLRHPRVRETLRAFCDSARHSWTSHTFNEVWVGGRWCRLNYAHLGQDILDPKYLGLMTHVLTVHDWAEARIAETVGRRQGMPHGEDAFGHANPYSALSLGDRVGDHAQVDLAAPGGLERLTIDALLWTDAPGLRSPVHEDGGLGLLGRVSGGGPWEAFREFTASADDTFFLEADGHPPIELHCAVGGLTSGNARYICLLLGERERAQLESGVRYRLRARNADSPLRWVVRAGPVAPRR